MTRLAPLLLALACTRPAPSLAAPPPPDAGAGAAALPVVEWVLKGQLQPRWHDFGYSPHGPPGEGQLLDLSGHGGWILATRTGDWQRLGDLVFRYQAPEAFGDFLEVKLANDDDGDFPRLAVTAARRTRAGDGWLDVRLPMAELNPSDRAFDRIRFKATRKVGKDWVRFDRIGFQAKGAAPERPPAPVVPANLVVSCKAAGHPISPWIYGIASSHKLEAPFAELGATAARWGGNTSSRYNHELGNAWNAGSDWFFRNTNYAGTPTFTWRDELAFNRSKGLPTALTVPTLGWVAKDTTSFSFPVSELGKQASADGDAGNGVGRDGKPLPPGPATRTSVPSDPASIARWVGAAEALDADQGRKGVLMYILDNEPGLWHETHRDVHPLPVTYDELLEKTIAYGTAVRKAAPKALIAGPAEWGWSGYLYSAADLAVSARLRPDRRAHDDEPLLAWYVRKLAEHEKKTGVRVLDVLDVHYYPQAKGIGLGQKGSTDPTTAALRIRSTRSLWDPTYVDESWIRETVRLLPRLREWAPGLKLSLGEYNWGAEGHISGGLALAELLGRFGEQDLFSAFYWRVPATGSPAWFAFRAYRNYDGKGATFPNWHVPTRMADGVSLFAARDEASKRLVLVALNLQPDRGALAQIVLDGCRGLKPTRTFVYTGEASGPVERPAAQLATGGLTQELPPSSITVLELQAEAKGP